MIRVLAIALLLTLVANADEPKHVNSPVTIKGTIVTMKLDFWKHVVDTMDWQGDKINELQTENLSLKAKIKSMCECRKEKI